MGIKTLAFVMLGSVLISACSSGHCRRKADTPAINPGPQDAASAKAGGPTAASSDRVFIYKYDGSLQCGKGKAVSLDSMAAQELQGVPVLSSSKKSDGLMHIQACGSITGMANVYEISVKHLKKAETAGFKKWSFE